MYRILDHIGQLSGHARPSLAYMAANQDTPKWHAQTKQRIEDAIDFWNKGGGATTGSLAQTSATPAANLSSQAIVIQPSEYQMVPGDNRAIMPARELANKMKTTVSWDGATQQGIIGGKTFKPNKVVNGTAWAYVRFVLEDHGYFVHWDQNTKLITATKRLESTTPKITVPSSGLSAPTAGTPSRLEKDLAAYEAEVWGRRFSPNAEAFRKHNPFFYTGEHMGPLRDHGFDIYAVYGPLPDDVIARNNQLPDTVSYNTTVKAVRNIQLYGVSQVLGADGRPVEEIYSFIAQDME